MINEYDLIDIEKQIDGLTLPKSWCHNEDCDCPDCGDILELHNVNMRLFKRVKYLISEFRKLRVTPTQSED